EHPIVVTLEDRFGLLRRQLEPLQVLRLVRLEGLAILVLHQRHAKHVDAVTLAGPFGIEHERAGDVVVNLLLASHRRFSVWLHIYNAEKLGNVGRCRSLGRFKRPHSRLPNNRASHARFVMRDEGSYAGWRVRSRATKDTGRTGRRRDSTLTPVKAHRIIDQKR